MTKKNYPSINGFSIRDAKILENFLGIAANCKLYFENTYLGSWEDRGDGGCPYFYQAPGFYESTINKAIKRLFPKEELFFFDEEEPKMIDYDLDSLVNNLITMDAHFKKFNLEHSKLRRLKRDFFVATLKNSISIAYSDLAELEDKEVFSRFVAMVEKTYPPEYTKHVKIKRYKTADDFVINDTKITIEDLKN